MPARPLGGALRRRKGRVRQEPRPEPVLPGTSGVAIRGTRAVSAAGAGCGGAVVRGHADDAGRLAEMRELAAELADEPQHPHSAAERVVRRRALLLRDPAPPDHLPQLPRRLQRLRTSECDADSRREKSRAELPELVVRRLH